jgi:hypothetical protein
LTTGGSGNRAHVEHRLGCTLRWISRLSSFPFATSRAGGTRVAETRPVPAAVRPSFVSDFI